MARRYSWHPTFRAGTLAAGILGVQALLILLQQMGQIVYGAFWFWIGLVLGISIAAVLKWSAHAVAVSRANRQTGGRHG